MTLARNLLIWLLSCGASVAAAAQALNSGFQLLGFSEDGKYLGYTQMGEDKEQATFINIKENRLVTADKELVRATLKSRGLHLFFHPIGDDLTEKHRVKFIEEEQILGGTNIYTLNLTEKKLGSCTGFKLVLSIEGHQTMKEDRKPPRSIILQDDKSVPKSRSGFFESCPFKYEIESAFAGPKNSYAFVVRQYRCTEHCTPAHDIGYLVVTHQGTL